MLIHHSDQSYDVAASEAAASARHKMEALIAPGLKSAQTVLEQVQTQVPTDRVVAATAFEIEESRDARFGITLGIRDTKLGLVKNSFSQLCQVAGLPQRFAGELLEPVKTVQRGEAALAGQRSNDREVMQRQSWATELLAHNLKTLMHNNKGRYLVRAVNDDARGILSDSYRRLDCRPLLESFALAAQHIGAIAVDGHATETKIELKAMLPMIFEPIPNEVMCFGVAWSNSDFGNGAHSLRSFVLRLVCTNKAVADEQLRQIHLGKRIEEHSVFSERTYKLDTKTTASALYDVVGNALSPDTIHAYQNRVRSAHAEHVDRKLLPGRLARMDLGKEEQKEILNAYDSPDVEMIPPGANAWRLSNSISWFAGNRVADEERRMELEKLAGKVLPGAAKD